MGYWRSKRRTFVPLSISTLSLRVGWGVWRRVRLDKTGAVGREGWGARRGTDVMEKGVELY